MQEFYNSGDNFQNLGSTANRCKGDARVYEKDKNGNFVLDENGNKKDITHKASAEEMTEAVIEKLEGGENRDPKTTQKLKDEGILDENGKVKPDVKRKLKENIEKAQREEEKKILKNIDKTKVAKTAGKETTKQIGKMIAGQMIYYILPPVIYEIKEGISNNSDGDSILENLYNSSKRVIEYVASKLKNILSIIFPNGFKKFIKNFFDIILGLIRGVFKRIIKLAKELIIVTIDAIKILFDSSKTFLEKMDAIVQLIGGLFTNVAIGLLFEYLSKQFLIPEWALLPIEMITRVVLSNFVMLALKKLDLFAGKKKLKAEKIKMIFEEEEKNKNLEIEKRLNDVNYSNEKLFEELQEELFLIKSKIEENDVFNIRIKEDIKRAFQIFGKNLELNNKFKKFLGEV